MIKLYVDQTPSVDKSEVVDSYWYQVSESTDERDILCDKWTNTLLIGTQPAISIMLKGKGLFEMVEYRYVSAFQGLYDTFVQEACNFVQVGPFHRFWLTSSGLLRVIVVTPQTSSSHPEWIELFNGSRNDILNMRILGRRIGYFINEIEKDSNSADIIYSKKTQKKGDKSSMGANNDLQFPVCKATSGVIDRYTGLHLYRCGLCKRSLLKPLQCSRCRSIVYCSRQCQRADWTVHSSHCTQ